MMLSDYLTGAAKGMFPIVWSRLQPWLAKVKITSPLNGQTVDDPRVRVEGTYRCNVIKNLILFHQDGNEVYPQGSAILDPPHKRWSKEVKIGTEPGKEYMIVIASVSDEAFSAVQFYSHTGKERGVWKYPIPIYAIRKGYISLDSVTVKLAGRVGQAP
jgi:hypothetical protein